MFRLIVDADACPVKAEINQLAEEFQLDVIYVASYNHFSVNRGKERWLFVDTNKEAADLKIVSTANYGDIVITQDIGLSSMLLAKCDVFSNRGEKYQEREIERLLDIRHQNAKARRSGHYSKGPSKMTAVDNQRFYLHLKAFIANKQKEVNTCETDSRRNH
ncbi:DUF188 domain-containing protein [Listeria sp. PSOL-1]|uniref:YaiI/YqxD family protein n=1 Tax=Listeria sp. PSOL-1 TaxID=1844999 RepID=UPI0013D51CFF|nr:DUF188 domain-containing protein [Listeria sp. PSOL-1]